ncbi:ABC-2 [Syntrophobacter sp. SbD1]|nr:ABC-2 [Syntrophobacter sp. SbD1]
MRKEKFDTDSSGMNLRRTRSLVHKEFLQIIRDPSSIALALVLPVFLILLIGYGLSLDPKDIPLAVVLENPTPDSISLAGAFKLSRYFKVTELTSMHEAVKLIRAHKVDGIMHLSQDFDRQLSSGSAPVQLIVRGVDANRGRFIQGYAHGAIAQWTNQRAIGKAGPSVGPVQLQTRMWFNEAVDSHYFLVPGLLVLIMTLTGALLTALVMAREWEQGTLESLFVTPVHAGEILIGKTLPYFLLGMAGLLLTASAGRFLFHVPIKGSIFILAAVSAIYLLVALGLGLLISSAIRNQFVAGQITLIVAFLPAVFLSGFIFDLKSVPKAVQIVSYLLPARYYVSFLQTIFLAGNVWSVIIPNAAAMMVMSLILFSLTLRKTRKRLN